MILRDKFMTHSPTASPCGINPERATRLRPVAPEMRRSLPRSLLRIPYRQIALPLTNHFRRLRRSPRGAAHPPNNARFRAGLRPCDRMSTRLNSCHYFASLFPSSSSFTYPFFFFFFFLFFSFSFFFFFFFF